MADTVLTIVVAIGGISTVSALGLFLLRIAFEESFDAIDEKIAEKIRGKDDSDS